MSVVAILFITILQFRYDNSILIMSLIYLITAFAKDFTRNKLIMEISMKKICMEDELSRYNLEGKWNDYIAVQKEVLHVLRSEDFFDNRNIINLETGMCIRINPKGIKETLGTGKRFQSLPKKIKCFKVATIYSLPWIIENATLIKDDVRNNHEKNGYMFAYLKSKIMIDDELVEVRITVMKKIETNWFWIHHIDEKSSELLDPSNG